MSHTSRRTFLKASVAAVATTSIASRRLAAAPLSEPIGLQLYSVRQLLPKDFDGTLHQLAAAGYVEVEAAGYFDRTAAQLRHSMDQAGLRCISTHYAMGMLRPRLDELIEYAHNLGCNYIVCPSPVRKDPTAHGPLNLEDWRWVTGELNRIGEKVKAAGMSFGYHNHTPEFGSEGGVVFYDELLRLTDPKLVFFEMDCGWVFAAGRNPIDYLSKTPERFPLLHVKDMAKGPNGQYHSVVLGRGAMDYKPILRAATGLKHYFIEQEEFDIDTFEALRLDADYMRKLSI
ncbi:MAG TPA: sugar phosphate isomerase/epimerase [Terracidiphilus sp.]|jgi:sugar phosphate isomerase/epimerase|nr:sugar phosphate isomerase/epimerase [Terracidiphilus sp.]